MYSETMAVEEVELKGKVTGAYSEILTEEVLAFVASLHRKFNSTRVQLLARREERQLDIDNGVFPDFLEETKSIREDEWTIDAIPSDLADRRVEITGPVERTMVINALNCGAKVFMADFEDSNAPTSRNVGEGQRKMRDVVNQNMSFTNTRHEE